MNTLRALHERNAHRQARQPLPAGIQAETEGQGLNEEERRRKRPFLPKENKQGPKGGKRASFEGPVPFVKEQQVYDHAKRCAAKGKESQTGSNVAKLAARMGVPHPADRPYDEVVSDIREQGELCLFPGFNGFADRLP